MTLGRSIRLGLALLVAAGPIFATGARLSGHHESSHRPAQAKRRELNLPIPDFSLKDQTGRPFSFQKLRGKLVLMTFVYTTCPDACPLITSSLRQVQRELRGSERNSIFLLSITTDPEIDKPQVLKSYGERYGVDFSNWSFLTGHQKELAPVWKTFGVRVERKARGLVDHTSLTALLDKKGVVRVAYHGPAPDPKVILRDLRALLNAN
ncbi:MAG: SCO family protein [Candidatus Binatia bacterium]